MLTEEMLNAKNLGIIKNSGSIVLDMPDGPVGMAYFKFTVEEGCVLNFSADSLSLSFYDANGNLIMLNGYGSYTYEFTPGDYYITPMGGSTSDITLNITYAEAIVGNNSVETAYNWGTVSGEKTFENIYIAGSMGGMPGTGSTAEYYSFTLTEDSLITISASSPGAMAPMGPTMTIIDSEGKRYSVASSMGAATGPSPLELKSGTYTLEIGASYGSFSGDIVISQEKGIAGNDTPETAYNLGTVSGEKTVENIYIPSSIGGMPSTGSSTEYYSFTLTEDSLISISALSSGAMAPMGPTMTIIDSEGKNCSASGSPSMMGPAVWELKSGTYTLAISTSYGTYSGDITISQSKNIIGNDTPETAYDWGTISGENIFENIYLPSVMGSPTAPTEYYKFTITEDSLIYISSESASTSYGMPATLTLIDSEGKRYEMGMGSSQFIAQDLAAGTYTLECSSAGVTTGNGFYDITVSQFESISGNNTVETAYDWGNIVGTKTFKNIYVTPSDGMGNMPQEFYSFILSENTNVGISFVTNNGYSYGISAELFIEKSDGTYESLAFPGSGNLEAGKYVLCVNSTYELVNISIATEITNEIYISSSYKYYCPPGFTYGENAFASISDANKAGYIGDRSKVVLKDSYVAVNDSDYQKLVAAGSVYGNFTEDDKKAGTSSFTGATPAAGMLVFNNVKDQNQTQNKAEKFKNFLTVQVNDSEIAESFTKNHNFYKNYDGSFSYINNGSFTVNNSSVKAISNYQTVIATNSNAGNIINNSVYKTFTDHTGAAAKLTRASGYLSITANNSAKNDKYTVGADSAVDNIAIDGYATVNISGYKDWAGKNHKEIEVLGDLRAGNWNSSYFETAGSITLNNNITVKGDVSYYTTVNASGNIDIEGDISKGAAAAMSYSTQVYDNSAWVPATVTQYTKNGSVNFNDVEAGNITDYQNVILTNSTAGNVINRTLTKQTVLLSANKEVTSKQYTYNSNGYFSISASNGDKDYSIGNPDNSSLGSGVTLGDDGSENIVGTAIYGYGTVSISGYKNWANHRQNKKITVNGGILGGNRESKFIDGSNISVKETSTGSANISLADVKGDVNGFTNVTLSDASVKNIDNLYNTESSYSYTKTQLNSSNEYEQPKVTVTNYNSNGYLSASNSNADNIYNYLTVSLTNSSAGNVSRDMLSNITSDMITTETYTAAGSFNMSATQAGEYSVGQSTAAAVKGYNNVNISGYTNWADQSKNQTVKVNGSIVGGKTVQKDNEVQKTSSGSANITLAEVAGNIEGYTSVILSKATVQDINNFDNTESSYSYTKTQLNSSGESEQQKVTVTNYNSNGYLSASNSTAGNINNYLTVSLTNSSVGNVSRYMLSNVTSDMIRTETYTAAGSFNMSATQAGEYSVGQSTAAAVKGYNNVNISGYTNWADQSKNQTVKINGSIVGGKTVKTVETDDEPQKTSSGSANITLAKVTGNIEGYTSVTLSKATVKDINNFGYAFSSYSYTNFDGSYITVYNYNANGYLSASNSTTGNINNYLTVSLTNAVAGDIKRATNTSSKEVWLDDKLTLTTTNNASGSLYVSLNYLADKTQSYEIGDVDGYANVTINGYKDYSNSKNNQKVTVNSISGGNSVTSTDYSDQSVIATAAGSVTIGAEVEVTGAINGYNIVSVNSATVKGVISASIDSEKIASGTMATFTNSTIGGVANYTNVSFIGENTVAAINGNELKDANININYGAKVYCGSVALDKDDKLNVYGTLFMTGNSFSAENVKGNGEILAENEVYAGIKSNLSSSTVKLVNLGQTAENFVSTTAEHADDYSYAPKYWADAAKKESIIKPVSESSFIADSELDILQTKSVEKIVTEEAYYNGYLSGNFDGSCRDFVDYVRFYADKDGWLELSCTTDGVADNIVSLIDEKGEAISNNYKVVKGTSYVIGIKLDEEYTDSVSYQLAYQA